MTVESGGFVGRAADMARLLALLEERPVVLVGLPGSGKSAVVEELRRRVPGLAVVDGEQDPVSALTGRRRPAVATSRRRILPGSGLQEYVLGPMGVDDAAALLAARLPTPSALRRAPEGIRTLAERAVRLPGALIELAQRVAATPSWTLADHLVALREPLCEPGPQHDGFRAVVDTLDDAHRTGWALLALHTGPHLSVAAAAALWETAPRRAEQALRLLAAHLLADGTDGRWRLPVEVAPYARWCLSHDVRPTVARQARTRLLEFYLREVEAEQTPEWFAGEAPNLLAAAMLAVKTNAHTLAIRFGRALQPTLVGGSGADLVRLARHARNAAELLGDPQALAQAELQLGGTLYREGDFAGSRDASERAAALAARVHDHSAELEARNAVVRSAIALGDYHEPVIQLRRIITSLRSRGESRPLAQALVNLAGAYLRLGADEDVVSTCEEALAITEEAALPALEVAALALLVRARLRLGRRAEADEALARARSTAARTADVFAQGTVDVLTARMVSLDAGMAAAEPLFAAAARAAASLPQPWAMAQLQVVWGEAHLYGGDPDRARPHFRAVLDLMGPTGADFLVRVARAGLAACDGGPVAWRGTEIAVETQAPPPSVLDVLSAREREVAERVADGDSNRQIAARLGISARTVEDHVARICRKMQLPSRAAIGRRIAEQ